MARSFSRSECGAALLVALVMLMLVLTLGLSAAQIALQGEKASRADRDRQLALQAAEAGLLDAERDIDGADPDSGRGVIFSDGSTEGFTEGCGTGLYLGLCRCAEEGKPPVWETVDLADMSEQSRSVPYGYFTGRIFPSAQGPLPARLPRYIIELLPLRVAGESAESGSRSYLYRITAIGFGANEETQVVLQSIYRKGGA